MVVVSVLLSISKIDVQFNWFGWMMGPLLLLAAQTQTHIHTHTVTHTHTQKPTGDCVFVFICVHLVHARGVNNERRAPLLCTFSCSRVVHTLPGASTISYNYTMHTMGVLCVLNSQTPNTDTHI